MGNRKTKKLMKQIEKSKLNNVLQDQMIEIHTEAYYRALKRIEQEKEQEKVQTQEKKQDKWYTKLLFMLNVVLWPWKINKRFSINKRLYDSLLVLFVTVVLQVVGFLLWSFGVLAIIVEICQILKDGISSAAITTFSIALFMPVLGSAFTLAGKEFNNETDSNKIYAFSACVIALISCVVAIISLTKM